MVGNRAIIAIGSFPVEFYLTYCLNIMKPVIPYYEEITKDRLLRCVHAQTEMYLRGFEIPLSPVDLLNHIRSIVQDVAKTTAMKNWSKIWDGCHSLAHSLQETIFIMHQIWRGAYTMKLLPYHTNNIRAEVKMVVKRLNLRSLIQVPHQQEQLYLELLETLP